MKIGKTILILTMLSACNGCFSSANMVLIDASADLYPPLSKEESVELIPLNPRRSIEYIDNIDSKNRAFKFKGDKTGQVFRIIGDVIVEHGNRKDRIDIAMSQAKKYGADVCIMMYSVRKRPFGDWIFFFQDRNDPRMDEEKEECDCSDHFKLAKKLSRQLGKEKNKN